jgi:arylsulfatase A-like enzyme
MIRTRSLLLSAAGALVLPSAYAAPDAVPAKPNVVVILADDLGYGELGCQGNKQIPTPNIDAIARAGVRFTDGYVSCPVCSPTRAGLLTSRYQQRFGHEFNPGPNAANFGLDKSQTTLAERFRDAGYVTGMVGKWHLGNGPGCHPLDRGFQEFFGFPGGAHSYTPPARPQPNNPVMRGRETVNEKEYLTRAFARESEAFIRKHRSEPFFLYLAFNAVHAPMQAPEGVEIPKGITDPKRRTFAGMLTALDTAVGRVTAALCEAGLEENTLVFFLSDNGGPTRQTTSRNGALRGYKGDTLEGGIRVPFMVKWPARLPKGKTYAEPVIALDIGPTALAACGIETKDARLDGVNLIPFLSGSEKGAPHESLFWRFGQKAAVRQGDWKLVRMARGSWQLYDLSKDKGESKDLSSENPERVRKMRDAWDAWNRELKPPAWKPAPAPARQTARQPAAKRPASASP